MGKYICKHCGVEICTARGDKDPKVCPRCGRNPLVKEVEKKFGEYVPQKRNKKHFRGPEIEVTKSEDSMPEVQEDTGDVDQF